MRVSKKTYTKRRRGAKNRNYKKKIKSRRKRVRGGIDPPSTPDKRGRSKTLRRSDLEKLRRSGDRVKGFEQSDEPDDYNRFEPEDFNPEVIEPGYSPGYQHGVYHGKRGYEAIDFHYIPMTEKVNDIVIDKSYRDDYREGYAAAAKNKEGD